MNEALKNSPVLPVYLYQLQFNVDGNLRLPEFAGSAWRGAFGHALKKTVCVVRDTSCANCMLKTSCAYSYVFETPPPTNSIKMRKYNASPHPYVLQFPIEKKLEQKKYALNMALFGHGKRFFPYIVHAMQKAGQDGIGSSRQVFKLEAIKQSSNGVEQIIYQGGQLQNQLYSNEMEIPPMPESIKLVIHTPIRIKKDGRNLNQVYFNFGALFGNILRRISMLTYFHTDTPLDTDFAGLMQRAKQVRFKDKELRWHDWKRYSSRQKTEMNMGGLLGSLEIDSKGMEDFWPYLWIGQWTHVGKATSMGLGHYSIEMASLLPMN